MRKILLLVICCIMLCGCGKKFEVSNFRWEKIGGLYHSVGSVKNSSNEKCNHIHIKLVYKNGELMEEGNCNYSFVLESGEVKNVECLYTGNLSNIQDYEIIIKNIECQDYLYD